MKYVSERIENMKYVSERIENILGKGENAGYLAFSPLPKTFSIASFLRVVKSRDCVVKRYTNKDSLNLIGAC